MESDSKNVSLLHNISDPCVDSVTSADLFNNIITTFYFCELCQSQNELCSNLFFCVDNRFHHLLSSVTAELMRLYSLQFVIKPEGLYY